MNKMVDFPYLEKILMYFAYIWKVFVNSFVYFFINRYKNTVGIFYGYKYFANFKLLLSVKQLNKPCTLFKKVQKKL